MTPRERVAPFDFGLSAALETRARQLHHESIVFDLLSQHAGGNIFSSYSVRLQTEFRETIATKESLIERVAEAMYWPYEMSKGGRSDLIREWFMVSGLSCGTYGISVHEGLDPSERIWEDKAARYRDLPWLRYVTTAAEIRQAKRDGVIAFYAHCQPVKPAPRDIDAIDMAYAKGMRSFMLTYNLMDNIGVGCTERLDAGLSRFGLDVVKHCNEIGVIIDVSHCGHMTTMDACRHSKRPVTANHTAAKGVYDHPRGKSDDALRAIADTAGVIGVVAVPFFLSGEPQPTIEHMLDHIDYIATLVGWQHVAIGTDWPLQIPDEMQLELVPARKSMGSRNLDPSDVTCRLVGFEDCRDLPNITRGLVRRGYNDEQIRGIIGENALRVFGEVCG